MLKWGILSDRINQLHVKIDKWLINTVEISCFINLVVHNFIFQLINTRWNHRVIIPSNPDIDIGWHWWSFIFLIIEVYMKTILSNTRNVLYKKMVFFFFFNGSLFVMYDSSRFRISTKWKLLLHEFLYFTVTRNLFQFKWSTLRIFISRHPLC